MCKMKVRRGSKAIQTGDSHVLKLSRTLQNFSRYKLLQVSHFLFVEKALVSEAIPVFQKVNSGS